MVQIVAAVGAVALLSSSAFAAPAVRRSQQYQYDYKQEEVKEPEYKAESSAVYEYESAPLYHETSSVAYHETSTYEYAAHETSTYEYAAKETYTPEYEYDTYTPEYDSYSEEYVEYETVEEHPTSTYEYEEEAAKDTWVPEHPTEAVWQETTDAVWHETTSADYAYPTYGSGADQWGAGYDDCVSQCVAKHGAPSAVWTPPAHASETASGVIHTVLVAPTAGVLRYHPFALNATVGDTVRYIWSTPANHTATLSSELAICNRSAEAESRNFVSGIHNGAEGEHVFDVVVQTEEPQFFYCSVQQHCEKGMWGIINPKSEFGGLNTVGAKMNEWVESNPDLSAAWGVVHETTKGTSADTWGNSISLEGIPESEYSNMAANIIYGRAMFGANPGMLETDQGATTPDGSPLTIVGDLKTLLSATVQDPNAADVPRGTPTGEVPVASDVAEELAATSSAGVVRAGAWSAAVVAVATWFLF